MNWSWPMLPFALYGGLLTAGRSLPGQTVLSCHVSCPANFRRAVDNLFGYYDGELITHGMITRMLTTRKWSLGDSERTEMGRRGPRGKELS